MYHKTQSYQCLVWLVFGKRADTAVRQKQYDWESQLTVEARSLENVFAAKNELSVI